MKYTKYKIANRGNTKEMGETTKETVETLGETCRNTREMVGNS